MRAGPRLRQTELALLVGCWLAVLSAALLQHTLVLRIELDLASLLIPNVVGLLVGAGLVALTRGRRHERELRAEVERQAAEVRRLNAALQQRVEDRTIELRAREAELLQSQKMEALGRLAGGVAHDFNNLLTGILQGSELIIEMADDAEATREMAGEVREAALRAAKLTARLLSLGRRRRVPEPLVPVDLATVIRGLQPLVVRLLGERAAVAIELSPGTPPILADRTHLEQVVLNLCVNARDAMPDGGRLVISLGHTHQDNLPDGILTNAKQGAVHLVVQDTGCGIPAELTEQVFEPLFTTKEPGAGTGLGLSIVQSLVHGAQGVVRLTSTEGVGTRFDVYWPALGPDTKVPAPTPLPAPPRSRTGPLTILLLEDNDSVRSMVMRTLRARGHKVIATANGDAAEKVLDRGTDPVDLVLSDIQMPGRSGIDLLPTWRARLPGASIVLMTGLTNELLDPERLVELGVLGVLRKPFEVRELDDLLG